MSSLPLPTELIQHILDDVLRSHDRFNRYVERLQRQKFLATCCLVSQSFLLIARPLLYSTIETRNGGQLDDLAALMLDSGHGALVKKARFRFDGHSTSSISRVAKSLPKIEHLRLSRISMEGLAELQKLRHLQTLVLGGLYLDCLTNWTFDLLEELVMVLDDWRNPLTLITRKRFPSLKSLAIRTTVEFRLQQPPGELPGLVWSLKRFVLDPKTIRRLHVADVARISSPVLVGTDLRIVVAGQNGGYGRPRLLEETKDDSIGGGMNSQQLHNACAYLQDTPLTFAAIILPFDLTNKRLFTILGLYDPFLCLLEVCTAKGVEVLYEKGGAPELLIPKVWTERVRSKDQLGEA